jgi:hypothetical protein
MNTSEGSRFQEQHSIRYSDGLFRSRVRANAMTAHLFVGYGLLEYRPPDVEPTRPATSFWLTLVVNEAGRAVCFEMSVDEPHGERAMAMLEATVLTKHRFQIEPLHLTIEDSGLLWSSIVPRAIRAGVQLTWVSSLAAGRSEPLLRRVQARLQDVAGSGRMGRTGRAPPTDRWPAEFWTIRHQVEMALP